MAITWRGLGYLGFMIPFVAFALGIMVGGFDNDTPMRVFPLLAAVVVWFLGKALNKASQAAGEPAEHQAFGFPMQWSTLLGIGGFVLTFT